MTSVKKIKLVNGFAEFDPSSVMPLQLEQLVSLTPPNTHFFFPSEADIQQQYTLRNIRKYTCAFLIGLGLLGSVGNACANPDKGREAESVSISSHASAPPPPYAPGDDEGSAVLKLKARHNKLQLHEQVPLWRKWTYHTPATYLPETLYQYVFAAKTPEHGAIFIGGLAKFMGKYKEVVTGQSAKQLIMQLLNQADYRITQAFQIARKSPYASYLSNLFSENTELQTTHIYKVVFQYGN